MDIKKSDTAVLVVDPQNDFLSEQGATWGLVGNSVRENRTIENIERLFKTADEEEETYQNNAREIKTIQKTVKRIYKFKSFPLQSGQKEMIIMFLFHPIITTLAITTGILVEPSRKSCTRSICSIVKELSASKVLMDRARTGSNSSNPI